MSDSNVSENPPPKANKDKEILTNQDDGEPTLMDDDTSENQTLLNEKKFPLPSDYETTSIASEFDIEPNSIFPLIHPY